MGYRLRFDGVNDYCQFGSSMSIDLGLAAYTFEAKLVLNATPTALGGLLGRNGTSAGFFITSTLSLVAYASGTLRYQTAANFFLQDGNVHTYRLEHDSGGAWRAYRDGTLISSGTFSTTTTAAPLIWIGQGNNSSNSFCSMDLEYLEVTGVTNAQKWDANLSGGTGTTLPTTSGTNQATLINFPTDNSQWIFFSSGQTVAVNGSLPKLTGALTLNEINPSYTISVSGQLPKVTGAISLNEVNPVFTVAAAGQLPKLTGFIALNQFANNRQSAVIGVLPKLTGAITLNRIQPNNQVAVSGQLPKITASITLRVPDSYPSANPNDYTVSAYISTDSTYTARLSESSTINAIISASSTFNARLN